MIPKWPHVRTARVTLELETPLSIGSGAFDALYDSPVVRDANGLPTIPGTSLAGALKRVLPGYQEMFGDENGSSRLEISFAHIHGQDDRPVDGLVLDQSSLRNDPILSPLLGAPPLRQRVRINDRGTVEDTKKFDRCIVPGGHRFTFDLCLWGETEDGDQSAWEAIRRQWRTAPPRLGGSTRTGLGKVKVDKNHWREAQFDLRKQEDFRQWSQLTRALDADAAFTESSEAPDETMDEHLALDLRPRGGWRVGDGSIPIGKGKEADRLPLVEEWVEWQSEGTGERGSLQRVIVIPGAGIKGAVRHRTLFHYRRIKGWFAATASQEDPRDAIAEDQISALFGCAAEAPEANGTAGKLLFEDIHLPLVGAAPKSYPHNSIDRFTQGGRRGRLFSEEVLTGKPLLPIRIGFGDLVQVDSDVRRAFLLSLEDLAKSELTIGAGFARGQGFLEEASNTDWANIRSRLQIADGASS